MNLKRGVHLFTSLVLVSAMAINLSGCGKTVQAENLMDGIKGKAVAEGQEDADFISSQLELTLKLFKESVNESHNKNVLISPLSIQLSLAMTANGADGQTLTEMEKVLGGDIPIKDLNKYLHTYVDSLKAKDENTLKIANSIWFRGSELLKVEKNFLQTNADFYGAQIYKAPFDDETVTDINNWVNSNTDGMIDEIVDKINPLTAMYLINAISFDSKWEEVYKEKDIFDLDFTSISGNAQKVKMMRSFEEKYLDDGKATGFIKPYEKNKYSFAALLPNKGVDIYEYISGITASGLQNTLSKAKNEKVDVGIPKFSYEYELHMNGLLSKLGMPTAFNGGANFTKMGNSSSNDLYISDVLHKTFISVDELGTKAGAATKVEVSNKGGNSVEKSVVLDRPFIYMIIDNDTNLPVFIGTVMEITK